jgi:hypothetical protein
MCGDYSVPSLQNCEIIGEKSSELMIRKTSKIKGNAKEVNERTKKEYCFKAVSRTICKLYRADQ